MTPVSILLKRICFTAKVIKIQSARYCVRHIGINSQINNVTEIMTKTKLELFKLPVSVVNSSSSCF